MMNHPGYPAAAPSWQQGARAPQPDLPMDRVFQEQFIQTMPGYMPVIQMNFVPPPSLAPLYPHMLFSLISEIQSQAGLNHLRTLFFNLTSRNGYNNPMFGDVLNKLCTVTEIMLLAFPQQDPNKTVSDATVMYVQYRVSQQMTDFPQLQSMFDQETIQACMKAMMDFDALLGSWEQQSRPAPSGYGYGQPPQGGYGQRSYGNQVPQRGPVTNPYQAATLQSTQAPPHNPANGGAALRFGVSSSRFSENLPTAKENWRAPAPPAPEPPATTDWRATLNPAPRPVTPPLIQFHDTALPTLIADPRDQQGPVTAVVSYVPPDNNFLNAALNATVVEPPSPVATPVVVASTPRVIQLGQNKAYDPNEFVAVTIPLGSGHTDVEIRRKPAMDRELHLGRPTFAPPWTSLPTVQDYQARMAAAAATEPAGDKTEVEIDPKANPTFNEDELWTKATITTTLARSTNQKVHVGAQVGLILKAVVTTTTFDDLKTQLVTCQSLQKAGALLREAFQTFRVPEDLAALQVVNERLTQRVNRAINQELSLPDGDLTDFAADVEDQIAHLQKTYGDDIAKAYLSKGGLLIGEALYDHDPSGEFYQSVISAYFSDQAPDDGVLPTMTLFSEMICLAVVDLTSVELCLQLSAGRASSLLSVTTAPLAHEIAEKLLAGDSGPEVSSGKILRFKLRTKDNVTFEISRGALMPGAIMISLAA